MGIIERIGGRKFILAMIVIAVATAVEIYTVRGITTAFASLLGGLVAAFSAGNYLSKVEYRKTQEGSESPPQQSQSPEGITELKGEMQQVTGATVQLATMIDSLNKMVRAAISKPQQ